MDSYSFDKRKCVGCGACQIAKDASEASALCPTGARKSWLTSYTPEALCEVLLQDRAYFGKEGGVTFSGGECLLQSDFVLACEKILKNEGIHTAVDTCGAVPYAAIEKVLPYTDLFLYDIKHVDAEQHKRFTGHTNEEILSNFNRLYQSGAEIWVRVPIIGTFNASIPWAREIAEYLSRFPRISRVEALCYHTLGTHKYEMLEKHYPLGEEAIVEASRFEEIKRILNR